MTTFYLLRDAGLISIFAAVPSKAPNEDGSDNDDPGDICAPRPRAVIDVFDA